MIDFNQSKPDSNPNLGRLNQVVKRSHWKLPPKRKREPLAKQPIEAELADLDDRCLDLVETIPIPVLSHSEGRWISANQAAFVLFNASKPTDLIGQPIVKFMHSDDWSAADQRIKNANGSRQLTDRQVVKIIRVDGKIVTAELRGISYKAGDKIIYQITLYDISPLISAKEALHKTEINFHTLFETSPQGIIYHDADGKIITANPAALQILDISLADINGQATARPIWRSIRQDGAPIQNGEDPMSMALTTGQPVLGSTIGIIHALTGEVRWLSLNAIPQFLPGADKPYQVYSTFSDITDLKNTEDALRQSEWNYRNLFDTIPQGVIYQDKSGRIISANPAAQKILGFTGEELYKLTLENVSFYRVHEDGSEFKDAEQPVILAWQTGKAVSGVIMGIYRHPGDKKQWLRVDALPQFHPGENHPYQVYTIFNDITDLVVAMAAQKELLDQKERTTARDEAILNSLISGVITTDLHGCLDNANPSALKLLGFNDLNEARNYQGQDGFMMDLRSAAGDEVNPKDTPLARILEGAILTDVELQVKNHSTGEYRQALIGGRLAYNSEGQPLLGVLTIRDMQALHQAQVEHDKLLNELARRGAVLDAVFTATPDGVLIYSASGELTQYNPAARMLVGLTDELAQFSMQERVRMNKAIKPDGKPVTGKDIPAYQAMHGKNVRNYIVQMTIPDTEKRIWISISASPIRGVEGIGAVVSLTDITEHIELEEKLRLIQSDLENRVSQRTADLQTSITALASANTMLKENEERFRQLAENIHEVFVMETIDHAEILYISPAYEELWGKTRQSLYENPESLLDAIHPDDRQRVLQALNQIPGLNYDEQYRIVRPDGSVRWVRARAFIIRNEAGVPYRLAGIIEDITERVQSIQLLEKRVDERTRELSTLLSVSTSLTSTLEYNQLIEMVLDQLSDIVWFTSAMVLLVDKDEFEIVAVRGFFHQVIPPLSRFPVTRSKTLDHMISTRQAIVIDNMQNQNSDLKFIYTDRLLLDQEDVKTIGSWLGVPMIVNDNVVGIVRMANTKPHAFTPAHVQLVQSIANQAAVAIENARLYGQARELAALNERQRLARELHDSVSQALYGISLGSHVALASLERDPGKLKEALEYILSLADTGLTEMRALIFELRPESLATEGLVLAIKRQTLALEARRGIRVNNCMEDEPQVPLKIKETLFRVTQEALSNASRHANPTEITVTLNDYPDKIELIIADNGKGFDPSLDYPGHLGLHSMQERADQANGLLTITSAPGQGTTVLIQLQKTPKSR